MSATFRHQLLGSSPPANAALSTCSYISLLRRNVMFFDFFVSLLSSISILRVKRKRVVYRVLPCIHVCLQCLQKSGNSFTCQSRHCRHGCLQRRHFSPEFRG